MIIHNTPSLFYKRPCSFFLCILCTIFLSSCATNSTSSPIQSNAQEAQKSNYSAVPKEKEIHVIRYGRYRLVEVGVTLQQKDPLAQIIDVTIPLEINKKRTTVRGGITHVLLSTGYRFCDNEDVKVFNQFKLPLVHSQLGPMTVKDALALLAGPTWHITIDHHRRQICFVQKTPFLTKEINQRAHQ